LFGDGLVALGEGDGILKYKYTLDLESGGWENDDDEEKVENNDGDGNTNDRLTGTISEDEDELERMYFLTEMFSDAGVEEQGSKFSLFKFEIQNAIECSFICE
jgi:hypothetical protein